MKCSPCNRNVSKPEPMPINIPHKNKKFLLKIFTHALCLSSMNCSLSNAMSARALIYSLSLTPKSPPDISAQKRNPCLGFKHRNPFHFRIRLSSQQERCHVDFRVSGLSRSRSSSGERRGGKLRADVKSEPYDLSESIPESVKLDGVVLGKEEVELESDSSVPWWEQFPKRWVIVVLCFSAFLLCNMDRVTSFSFLFLYLFCFLLFLLCECVCVMLKMKLRK